MKTLVPLSLVAVLVTLAPSLAGAENLNWTVLPGNKPNVVADAIKQPSQTDRPSDVLVEAGLDDAPLAPVAEPQDMFDPDPLEATDADQMVADAGASTVLPEIESSGEVGEVGEVLEAPALKMEVAVEIPTESIDSGMLEEASPVTFDTPDSLDTNVSTEETAAIIEPPPSIATDLSFTAETTVAEEDATTMSPEVRSSAATGATEDVTAFTHKALATAESNDAEDYNAPIMEPVVTITPVQTNTSFDAIELHPVEESAESSTEPAPWMSEGNEDSNLAALEAEVNETLILGPVAIADDLADAAQGTEANTESASPTLSAAETLSTPEANPPEEPVGRYDEVMSEIIRADAIVDAEQPADAGEAAPLLLEEILELALANNPEVAMALAREEQARWGVREAAAYRFPTVDMVAELGPERNRPATRSSDIDDITPGRNINLRISKLLYDGGVSVAEEDRRRQIRRSTEIETRLVIEEIVLSAVESYMAILQNQQAARVAEEFVAEMQRMVNQISQMHQSGAASKIELDFAKSRLASARAQTGNSAAQLNDALSDLEFLTGDLPPFKAVAPINVSTVAVDTLINYVETARSNNAEILLNDSTKTTLSLKIRGQQAAYKPIVTLNFKSEGLQDEGGNSDPRSTTELKLKAEYFLIDGGVRKARIQRSKAQLMELEWDRERLIKDIDRRVKQSYNQITTNRLTLAATEDEIKANQELRRLNRQNLEIGDISILELIEVEERLFNSQATWHRISSEMLRNYYELLIGVGDLPAVLVHDYTTSRIDE